MANRNQRKLAAVISLLLSFSILAACSGDTSETAQTEVTSPESTQAAGALSFRITWKEYSGRGEAIQKIVDSYNSQSDGSVTMIGGDEDKAVIEALLTSSPDTVYVLPYRYVQYFSSLGLLADITAEFEGAEELFYPEVWTLGTVDSQVYGIPWLGHSMALLYNKTLLEKAGVDAASITSRDALVAAMDAVEAKTDAKGFGLVGAESNDLSWMVNQFIYGFGSSLVSDDGQTVSINNQNSKEALEFYRDVLGDHAQSTWLDDTSAEVVNYFREQQVAFEILGIWGVTDIQKNGSPFEVGIISLSDIGLCSEVGPMMAAIPAAMSDDTKQAACRFIRYLISMEAQAKIMNGEYSPEHDTYYPFRTPIRLDMANSQIFQSNPDYLSFLEGFQNPSVDVPVPAWQTIKDELYAPGLHQVMRGEIAIDVFLSNIETDGNEILTANQS